MGCVQATSNDICSALKSEFEIQKGVQLGKGNFATVLRAKCRSTDQLRAVKCIPKAALGFRGDQEASIMKTLDHPNIVSLFLCQDSPQFVYLVMELCAGSSLDCKLAPDYGMHESIAASLMQQLLKALVYLHGRGIVHLDVTLKNCKLLRPGGLEGNTLKLLDFGAALRLPAATAVGTLEKGHVATIEYAAPEVLMGHFSFNSDLWSAGICTYIMLSGALPFHGFTKKSRLACIENNVTYFEGSRWKYIGEAAHEFVQSLLEYDCSLRCSASDAMANRWIDEGGPPASAAFVSEPSPLKRSESITRSASITRRRLPHANSKSHSTFQLDIGEIQCDIEIGVNVGTQSSDLSPSPWGSSSKGITPKSSPRGYRSNRNNISRLFDDEPDGKHGIGSDAAEAELC